MTAFFYDVFVPIIAVLLMGRGAVHVVGYLFRSRKRCTCCGGLGPNGDPCVCQQHCVACRHGFPSARVISGAHIGHKPRTKSPSDQPFPVPTPPARRMAVFEVCMWCGADTDETWTKGCTAESSGE